MTDMLVRLYAVPASQPVSGVIIRRPLMPERHLLIEWVTKRFSKRWASECAGAFALRPIAGVVAIVDRQLSGFGVYDSTALGIMGPIGVREDLRGRGVGAAIVI